jgi:hypothetical protein|nr:MAG TPA: hypothetical protein [Caudoviricetes sp.]
MITRAGRELVETCGPMEKDAWIADRLSTRMLRGVGNLLRTSSIPMKALYHGAKAVGKGAGQAARAGARGLEWAGDAMRKYPVRTAYIGIPAVYGAHKLQSSLDRNLNNINSNNPYMSA